MNKRPGTAPRRKIGLRALVAALIGCLALTAAALALFRGEPPKDHAPAAAGAVEPAPAVNPPAGTAAPAPTAREQVVDDPAKRLLWESPTAGPPISLAWTPGGAQCLAHLRVAALAAHGEGDKVLAGLGPWGRDAIDRLEAAAGLKLAEIDAMLISIIERDDGTLDACLRVELVEPWDAAELSRRLPGSREIGRGMPPVRVAGDRAYLLPDAWSKPGGTLVVCPAALADELIDANGEAPPVVRDMESLIAHTDSLRDATILFAPRFLQSSGSELISGPAAPLRDGVLWLVDRDATAVAVSAHWDDDFYIELRAAPALNVPPRRLAAKLGERLGNIPAAIDAVVTRNAWPAYGRGVLDQFPAMLGALAELARTGDDDRLAVLNCYLPAPAGHNLLTASELLLTLPVGEAASAAGRPAEGRPQSIEDLLANPTSLSFPKDSLERALELLSEDLGVPIEVAGADLQLEGITRNQSLALDERDRPAGEILVEILRRANPDRTAASAADARQKLVYVVRPAAPDRPARIIVTTRSAATRRGETLPPEFLGAKP